MNSSAFEVESVVLCDDIRKEDNGKAILIGVYYGDIVVPTSPATLNLAIWIQGRANESIDNFELKIDIYGNSDLTPISGATRNLNMHVESGDQFLIAISGLITNISGPGNMVYKLKAGDHDSVEVVKKRFVINPSASIEQQQRP